MTSDRVQRRIDALLDEADVAVAGRNWEAVRSAAQAALAFDKTNSDARAYLEAAESALTSNAADAAIIQSTPAVRGTAAQPSQAKSETQREPAPASFANGRYNVKKFLGEGGKKRVYLAHDTTLDRDVAFALIKTDGLDATGRERVAREAQAMGRLGAHPHIVTVFDLGEEADQPYMVTELMGGGDIEGAIERAPEHKLPLDQSISIAVQVCQGLEFAHAQGIIHRDLKPGNVWLTVDGTAKIGDFGLAVAIDRTRLTQAGMMVGTVSYMPPEQAMGGEVTARSDLYSLGAMLYEMVTGRPPFLGDDHVAVIGQHLNTPPVAPSWHRADCPRPLEALILRLLAKDPDERPPSAADVRHALVAIDLSSSKEGSEAQLADANALDSLAGGVFVGRQREMGELKAALEDALSGRGRLQMLVGEPGIGKTRTAQELTTYAGLRGAQVLWGRCYDSTGVPPYWPWVQAIRSYVREADVERLRSEMGSGAADIAEIASEVSERLPDLRPQSGLDPEQARFRLFDSVTSFFKAAARHQPLVLVLEDLHWSDRPSLLLLEFLAHELSGARLLLLGTYRDVDITRQHPLALTLGELGRERLFQRILLRGLAREDVAKFIEHTTGVAPPESLVETVYAQTEGNPLFVTEVVRLLVEEGLLKSSSASLEGTEVTEAAWEQVWMIRIPEGVREAIGRRLSRLSERCNQVLTVAAVMGREFTLEQIGALVDDLPKERLLDVIEEALAARIIEELPRAVGRYEFTHALIQETLAGELTTTRRVQLHARIAEALERLYEDDADVHAAELTQHFAEAQTVLGTDKLVHYSLLAGERALASHAYEAALGFFQRALAAKGTSPRGTKAAADAATAALLFGLGRAQIATFPLHQIPDAVATMRRAFQFFEQMGDVAMAVAVAEYPLPTIPGTITGGLELADRALALAPPESIQTARLRSLQGRLLGLEANDYANALEAIEQALALSRRSGDVALEMRVLVDAAEVDGYQSDFKRALSRAAAAADLAGRVDDPRAEMVAHYWLLLSLLAQGDLGGAATHARAAVGAAQRLRYHFLTARALFGLALVRRLQGDLVGALEATDQALSVSPQETRALYLGVLLQFEAGHREAGGDYLRRLLEANRLMQEGPTMGSAYYVAAIALIAYVAGDSDYRAHACETGRNVVNATRVTPTVATLSRAGLGLIACVAGDQVSAREQYEFFNGNPNADWIALLAPSDRHHLLGVLATLLGEWQNAAQHFEDSLMFCHKAGYRPSLAWTCCDYAALLQAQRSDEEHARGLLDEGLTIARELSMRPLMDRIIARRELLKA
jgi:tetratricopeptide (TPR) repeat protein